MPDGPGKVITYAASASLAAVALIYFFNPNHLIDGESSTSSASTRRKGIVGLSNPANDCFINSVLQSLAGLGDLRLYLIRELHRRALDNPEVYSSIPEINQKGNPIDERKLESLQRGEVTQGLKDMIDNLNERPIYKKTISANAFIRVLEHAFGTRISKAQQDAQELLQIVAERLSEEYHAGREARLRARRKAQISLSRSSSNIPMISELASIEENGDHGSKIVSSKEETALEEDAPINTKGESSARAEEEEENKKERKDIIRGEMVVDGEKNEEEDGFPLEGKTEALIECQICHFQPIANPTTFVMLTLSVPQKSSTTLNECFDGLFKTEYIDDYKCDKCRLLHAVELKSKELVRGTSESQRARLESDIKKIQRSLDEDPEKPPEDVELPDSKLAPKRRIARHVQMTSFPKVLVIHLSRSIYDPGSISTKNAAKVAFPETLPLGGILNRRNYKLLGVVTHKGTHNSGHYESIRRQNLYAPYSTPHIREPAGPYRPSMDLSIDSSDFSKAPLDINSNGASGQDCEHPAVPSTASPTPAHSFVSTPSASTRPSSGSSNGEAAYRPPAAPGQHDHSLGVPSLESRLETKPHAPKTVGYTLSATKNSSIKEVGRLRRRKKPSDRWWRISDDKIKECKTNDILALQKEVYMLFYELEKNADGFL